MLGFLIRFLRLEIQLIPRTLWDKRSLSPSSLWITTLSQARGPFSGQTKQPWALWSLINNFHPAITLPDSLQLDRHKETLRRKERKQVGETDGLANKSFRWERARRKANRRLKRAKLVIWVFGKREEVVGEREEPLTLRAHCTFSTLCPSETLM